MCKTFQLTGIRILIIIFALLQMSLKKIDEEIAEFQKEKQDKLNAIDVVITLKMHQMEYLVDGQLPDDISMGLVFSNASLRRLKVRNANPRSV
jgi:hypothetical protein